MSVKPNLCTILLYSVDPPGLDAFHTFDPESFSTIPAINDALVVIESDGSVSPGLSIAWKFTSPTTCEFELRQGVMFHDGSLFDADDVVATFRAHREPTPSALGGGLLAVVKDVRRLDTFRVEMETAFPDAMLLRRLFFSQIYPKAILEAEGRDAFLTRVIGTGAYRLQRWDHGKEIVLVRNPDHWGKRATVDEIRIPIVRQKEWFEYLVDGRADMAWNIDSHEAIRLREQPGVHVASAPGAISQWFLLANRGPLADVRVRRALNHAIHRPLLVDVAEHGMGASQTSVATPEQEGFAADILPYVYDPERARALLDEAGVTTLRLSGLVCETSTTIFHTVREFLSRVGVELEAEIVPRSEWISRVVIPRLTGTGRYGGDFAIAPVDNPILDSIFHQFIFLFSQAPWSLLVDADYDQRFLAAATTLGDDGNARKELERYVADQALLLMTVRQHVHAASTGGFRTSLPLSGHFDYSAFADLHHEGTNESTSVEKKEPVSNSGDVQTLIDGTSHLGTFYLPSGTGFNEPSLERVWKNVTAAEARWVIQLQPMIRELVTQAEARSNLANVLSSTDRIGIIGLRDDGRLRFLNEGYRRLVDADPGHSVRDLLANPANPPWELLVSTVEREGLWAGPVTVDAPNRPANAPRRLHLSVARAADSSGVPVGHTLVFSDFSGEEERIRSQAVRTILDHVPYGLFRVDAEGEVLDGYSASCDLFFNVAGAAIKGKRVDHLLGLDQRRGGHLLVCISQVFDDVLPEEVSLGQIPNRIEINQRELALTPAAIRDDGGAVASVLITLEDVSELVAARREADLGKALLGILRFRGWFSAFVREHVADLRRLATSMGRPESQIESRRLLHTGKGVLAQFGLLDLAAQIHTLEDSPLIEASHLLNARDLLVGFLDTHRNLLHIDLADDEPTFEIRRSSLETLLISTMTATSLEQAQRFVIDAVAAMESTLVADLLGPVREAGLRQAERRGKRLRIEIDGEEVPVPAQLHGLFAVLPHLIRNAIDHGIELPEARIGKPETGTIRITVRPNDTMTRIEVMDDGAGISPERIVATAIERRLISPEAAADLNNEERLALVFLPGLSSAETVTDTSGRGMGTSAVEAAVIALGGFVSISSREGEGCRFVINVPTNPRRRSMMPLRPSIRPL